MLGLALFNGLFLVAAVLVKPDVGAIAGALDFRPFPGGSFNTLLLLLASTIGATVTPWMIFFQQSASADKGMTPADVLTTVFDAGHDEMVLGRDIEVYSTCEHHLVPFFGRAHVGYIPNEKGQITGLSKLARLVDLYARRPQVQERMTTQIADALMDTLEPRGVVVIIEAEHLCMSMRGVRKPGAKTVTSAVRGCFLSSKSTRAEAMSLLTGYR